MKFSTYRWIPLAALIAATASCDSGKDTNQAAAEGEAEAVTNRIEIPATVRSNIGITFAKVERRNVADTLRVPGSFELQPLAKHEYRLLLPSQVRFAVDQFDEVKPGTLLYEFQSPQWLELQSRIDLAVANHNQAFSEIRGAFHPHRSPRQGRVQTSGSSIGGLCSRCGGCRA